MIQERERERERETRDELPRSVSLCTQIDLYIEATLAIDRERKSYKYRAQTQAPKDFGLNLAYAAPEDMRRLGRGECCTTATRATIALMKMMIGAMLLMKMEPFEGFVPDLRRPKDAAPIILPPADAAESP